MHTANLGNLVLDKEISIINFVKNIILKLLILLAFPSNKKFFVFDYMCYKNLIFKHRWALFDLIILGGS